MIIIEKPYIKELKNKTRLICNIIDDGINKEVFLEVDKEYGRYLCYERCDAFLIVLFFYAMRENKNIVCKSLVSEDLYYQINEFLIPVFSKKSHGKLNEINIKCETGKNINNIGAVGTGITCGVDSFYTIFNNIENEIKSKKLTHLTIMSLADSYKKNGEYEKITKEIYDRVHKVSNLLKLPIIKINSNMRELFPIPPMHTLIRMFGVYSLQKLFGTYYFSSGYPIWTFNLEDCSLIDSARYDLLLCKELTTKNLFIYSDGSQKDRLEKLNFISQYDIAKKNLHVCTNESYNCGKCSKCIRTITALDSIRKLDEFSESFDTKYYYENIDFYLSEVAKMYENGDLFVYDYIDSLNRKYNNKIFKQIKQKEENNYICKRCYRVSDYNISKNNRLTIGIFGGSGSGKSEVCKILNSELKDSTIIDVDKYMIKYLDVFKSEIIEKLNIPNDGKHWCNHIYNNFEDVESWIKILKDEIQISINNELKQINNKIIIIDSFMLPLLDIFEYCNHLIAVNCDIKIKLSRLKEKLKENGRLQLFNDESLINRIQYTSFDKIYNYDHLINNDKTKNDLIKDVKVLSKKLT